MDGRFWISVAAVFALSLGLGFLVHAVLLGQSYAQLPYLYRPEGQAKAYLPFMVLAHALFAFAFAWVYVKVRAVGRPKLDQGLRFGILMALLFTIPTYLIYFSVQPLPPDLVMKQIVFDTMSILVMGVAVAAINR